MKNGRIEVIVDSAANQRTLASEKSVTELFYDTLFYFFAANGNIK